ncbi:hypothetical protein GCM10011390_41910 [Aureimonas endophytica]|uniref:Helix-turn-helix domain-containing protein n=1 Tax=Aureimonas endophytica TaxID=2027858 RepID=A0A916ZXS7_9HYPH|nr:helix-turn-helix domain-containing protein [Aureimonas endophytica]GGE18339.1 hypothetical protein GCM10011390_41910 [Aureimonas endophytica]
MGDRRCSNCIFWDRSGVREYGECRKNPPKPTIANAEFRGLLAALVSAAELYVGSPHEKSEQGKAFQRLFDHINEESDEFSRWTGWPSVFDNDWCGAYFAKNASDVDREKHSKAPEEAVKPGLLHEYLTVTELARDLGVTVRTIHRWQAGADGIPATRIGARTLFQKASVAVWLAERQQKNAGGIA